MTQSDAVKDTRSALELRLIERKDWTTLARAFELCADTDSSNPRFSRRERAARWHEWMATAAVYGSRGA